MTTAAKELNLVTDSRKMKNINSLVLYLSLCTVIHSLPIQSFGHIKQKMNHLSNPKSRYLCCFILTTLFSQKVIVCCRATPRN